MTKHVFRIGLVLLAGITLSVFAGENKDDASAGSYSAPASNVRAARAAGAGVAGLEGLTFYLMKGARESRSTEEYLLKAYGQTGKPEIKKLAEAVQARQSAYWMLTDEMKEQALKEIKLKMAHPTPATGLPGMTKLSFEEIQLQAMLARRTVTAVERNVAIVAAENGVAAAREEVLLWLPRRVAVGQGLARVLEWAILLDALDKVAAIYTGKYDEEPSSYVIPFAGPARAVYRHDPGSGGRSAGQPTTPSSGGHE